MKEDSAVRAQSYVSSSTITSPNIPHQLSISVNPDLTATIKGYKDRVIDIPPAITEDESSQEHPSTFQVVGIPSSSEEEPEEEVLEVALEDEYHQNMSDFYRGETEHAKETLTSIKRKVARITKLIRFKE
ncbi:hypothetical protein AMTR_s00076p00152920 [Amborella trichopoda]|uniref:Uncharacterized protein n=1 Tax=Amborella trichopoda TaxID=13333 RepID=W1PCE9_AMBTC|nr:hypothetical protein AMTR_s00076p00152920 [Amborella trichopoda]